MSDLRREYTLFIDESGQFGEEALIKEREAESPSSQICGILIPGFFEKRKRGDDLPSALLTLFPKGQEKHAVDMSHADRALLVEKVIKKTQESNWRLVRLVNNSGIGEGEVIQTYTRMVAEMIVCLYQTLREEHPKERPVIHLTYAQVLLGKRIDGRDYYFSHNEVKPSMRYKGSPIMIPILEYKEAIVRELQIDLRHGLGLTEEETDRIFGKVNEESARIHPALQLSDLVSNCSYKRGRALRHYPLTRLKLLNTLEPYDFELHPLKAQHQAEDLANHRALGQAIILVISHLSGELLNLEARLRLQETLSELLEDLAEEHSDELRSDLIAMIDAVADMVHRQRDFSRAEELIKYLSEDVIEPLEDQVAAFHGKADLNWVRYRLLNLALANANHSGYLALARQRRTLLVELRPKVNDRWEEIPIVMESQLNIAVSYGDSFCFEEGVALAEDVCGFYQDLSSLLSDFRGQSLLAPSLKIKNHMAALGTTLMLERYLCLERIAKDQPIDELIDRGRSLGNDALALSHGKEDVMRIHQQLAHLEAIGGHYLQAWRHLYLGLTGSLKASDELMSLEVKALRERCIKALDMLHDEALDFPIFHTLRLGILDLSAQGVTAELEAFSAALSTRFIKRCADLLDERKDDYPAHGLLRVWAGLNAIRGEEAMAIGALRILTRLTSKQRSALALHLVSICAHIEVAVYLVNAGRSQRALTMLKPSKGKKNDQDSLSTMMTKVNQRIKEDPQLSSWLLVLEKQLTAWQSNGLQTQQGHQLLKLAARYSG
jgi:hypothetical protein